MRVLVIDASPGLVPGYNILKIGHMSIEVHSSCPRKPRSEVTPSFRSASRVCPTIVTSLFLKKY